MRHPVLAAALLTAPLLAQQPAPSFEVVSIRPNRSGAPASETDTEPGRLRLMNVTPASLLVRAFGVSNFQIVDVPAWAATERYDVVATVRGGMVLSEQTRQEALQQMLADRWRLRYRRETRTIPVYSLEAGNGGHRLTAHADSGVYAMRVEAAGPKRILRSTRGNIPRLLEILGGFVGRPVVNGTGLAGEYDFTLEWVQDASAGDAGATLFTALREQLGLRLVPAERQAPVIVVESIERPSGN